VVNNEFALDFPSMCLAGFLFYLNCTTRKIEQELRTRRAGNSHARPANSLVSV
jgi:hypothetical protein